MRGGHGGRVARDAVRITLAPVIRQWFHLIGLAVALGVPAGASSAPMKTVSVSAPAPSSPSPTASGNRERITFGGGCFWCIEAVFQRLHGVVDVVSGYAGGTVPNPTYEAVTAGKTGHAEVVQLTFDPGRVSYATLLKVFWAAHDPTSVLEEDTVIRGKRYPKGTAYQGADVGDHYRSIILYETEAQRAAAEASRVEAQKEFKKPVATQIVPLKAFYRAEDYHQNYYNLNKGQNPYCGYVITPKLQKLLRDGLITADPVLP